MYPKKETVRDIIEKMNNLSSDEKIYLEDIVDAINSRQEKLFSEIKEEVKEELSCLEKEKIDIYMALVDSDDIRDLEGFTPVCPDIKTLPQEKIYVKGKDCVEGEILCGVLFFDGDFSEIDNICAKSFKAEWKLNGEKTGSTLFELRAFEGYIKKEKEIQQIAIQYKIEDPLIYNPMCRRAFEVYVKWPEGITTDDELEIDLGFRANGLENILLNKLLLWNVEEKSDDELIVEQGDFREIVPLWDDTFVKCCLPAKDDDEVTDYILVNNDLRAIKRIKNTIYWQINDNDPISCKKYSVYKQDIFCITAIAKKKDMRFYHNGYKKPSLGEIDRVSTKGDIWRCLGAFADLLGIKCIEIFSSREKALDGQRKIIYTYARSVDYYQCKVDQMRCPGECFIAFDAGDNDNYFIDKVSYILGYLNYRYPEYRWLGVC